MMTATEIRQSFLDFFREKQHTVVPSASLMPQSPGLLFTNAGMNQFVPYFLGVWTPPWTPARATDTQKCIRAGGKQWLALCLELADTEEPYTILTVNLEETDAVGLPDRTFIDKIGRAHV